MEYKEQELRDELIKRLNGRNQFNNSMVQSKPLIGDERSANIARKIENAAIGLFGGTPSNETNDLSSKIALLTYRSSLNPKNYEEPEGYLSESEIPKTLGGLPLKSVKPGKGGRLFPEYSAEKQDPLATIPQTINNQGQQEYLTGEEFLKTLPIEEQNIIKGLTNYSLSPEKTFGTRNDTRAKYFAYAKQYDPNFDAGVFNKRQKYLQELGSTKGSGVGRSVVSLNTAVPHLASLGDAMSRLSSVGGFPFSKNFNQIANWLKRSSGDASIADVDTALNAVAGELSTVFKGTGGTDQEIESWKASFDPNGSADQKSAFLQRGLELLEGRLGALEGQYEQTMGKEAPESTFIYPKTKIIFDKLKSKKTPSVFNNQMQSHDPTLDRLYKKYANS